MDESPISRGVVGIVVTGVLLGLAFNQLGRVSRPPHGLPWIAEHQDAASLETLGAQPKASAPTASPAPAPVDLDDPLGGALTTNSGSGLPDVPDLDRPLKVEADTVKKFLDARAALIIDARDAEEFAAGHIPGAMNLPYEEVASDPARLTAVESGGMPIIIYCGGGTCEVSMNLAESFIYQAGKRKVLVYAGGWPDWTQKGFPVEKGKQG